MTLNGSAIASSLMKLQTGQVNKRPLFLVHPAGGNLFCYAHLVRQLGADWPIYGLQAPGLIGEQEPYTQVEALAHYYVNLIRTIQPVGPYLLGGWSFGGIVAFEMAQQFQAEGQSVALLALLDSHMAKDDQGPEIDEATLLAALAQELGLTLGTSPDNADRAEQLDLDKQLAHLVEQARRAEVVSSDIDLDQVRRLFNVFKNNLHAARRYVPHPYTGPVVLFKASEQRSGTEEDLGWGALVGKNLTRLVIPGNHETILHEPNIPVLAKKIRNQLLATTLPS
jgi:thioesterase domain-containing protein